MYISVHVTIDLLTNIHDRATLPKSVGCFVFPLQLGTMAVLMDFLQKLLSLCLVDNRR